MTDHDPTSLDAFYLTKAQAARIAALTLDAAIGCQIRTDASDRSYAIIDMVGADTTERHFTVYTDGSYTEW
jgi:hypothetical protein